MIPTLNTSTGPTRPVRDARYRRIATEEAFAPPEMLEIYRKLLARSDVDPGFKGLMGFYMDSPSARAQHIMRCLTDLDQVRLQHMDEAGIDRQVIALTAPGVQVMDKATAVSFSRLANDQLADAVRRHPTRFTGMIAVAPQDPEAAAKEIERGVTQLGTCTAPRWRPIAMNASSRCAANPATTCARISTSPPVAWRRSRPSSSPSP